MCLNVFVCARATESENEKENECLWVNQLKYPEEVLCTVIEYCPYTAMWITKMSYIFNLKRKKKHTSDVKKSKFCTHADCNCCK